MEKINGVSEYGFIGGGNYTVKYDSSKVSDLIINEAVKKHGGGIRVETIKMSSKDNMVSGYFKKEKSSLIVILLIVSILMTIIYFAFRRKIRSVFEGNITIHRT